MDSPSKGLMETIEGLPEDQRIVRHSGGPYIRVATVCEDVIEEKKRDAITIFRLADGFYEPEETEDRQVRLEGFATFIGYAFPGDEEEPIVSFVITDEEGKIVSFHDRQLHIQGPYRIFAIATQLDGVRVPYGHRYSISMVYRLLELARTYFDTWVGSPEGPVVSEGEDQGQ